MTAQIQLRDISKSYHTVSGPVLAVEGVNLTVHRQEFLTLLGPSGCGKSTVLGMIGGLVRPDTGQILIDGERSNGLNPRKVAMVFQDPGLFPWRSALDNVGFGLELQGVPVTRRREVALELLEPMGLRGFERKYPRDPLVFRERGTGIRTLLMRLDTVTPKWISELAYATDDTIKTKKDALQRVLRGLFQGIKFCRDNPEETIKLASKGIGWPEAATRKAYELVRPLLSLDGRIDVEALRVMQDTLLELGVLKNRLPLDDHYTVAFTPVRI